jgi:hypothetical protein
MSNSPEAVELARIILENLREDYSWAKRPRELASRILAAETRDKLPLPPYPTVPVEVKSTYDPEAKMLYTTIRPKETGAMIVPDYVDSVFRALQDREPRGRCPLCGEAFILLSVATQPELGGLRIGVKSAEVICNNRHWFAMGSREGQ